MACAITAQKQQIPVAHVQAGIRSHRSRQAQAGA
ncbi:hypothetical protein H0A71_22750 [Alcaligenaceae bacterium]|nr:hypothetical protein [Alcaligenaceae bacterium]